MHLRDRGPVLGSSPDLQCGGLAVVQVFQESTPDFISACALLNQGVFHEVLNLPHEAGDEHTSDLIGTEMLHFTKFSTAHSVTNVTKVQDDL